MFVRARVMTSDGWILLLSLSLESDTPLTQTSALCTIANSKAEGKSSSVMHR